MRIKEVRGIKEFGIGSFVDHGLSIRLSVLFPRGDALTLFSRILVFSLAQTNDSSFYRQHHIISNKPASLSTADDSKG